MVIQKRQTKLTIYKLCYKNSPERQKDSLQTVIDASVREAHASSNNEATLDIVTEDSNELHPEQGLAEMITSNSLTLLYWVMILSLGLTKNDQTINYYEHNFCVNALWCEKWCVSHCIYITMASDQVILI